MSSSRGTRKGLAQICELCSARPSVAVPVLVLAVFVELTVLCGRGLRRC